MHRHLPRAITALLLLSFAGCKGDANKETTAAAPANAKQEATPAPPAAKPAIKSVSATALATGPVLSGHKAIAPLTPFAKQLVTSATRALLGPKPSGAPLAPFKGRIKAGIREHLQKLSIASLNLMGMELELVLHHAGTPSYYLRTFITVGSSGPGFLHVRGRVPQGGRLTVAHHPLARYSGKGKELAVVAMNIAKMIAAKKCTDLPIADPEALKKIIRPGRLALKMLTRLSKAPELRNKTCTELAAIPWDSLTLRVDDVHLGALGKDGLLAGTLRGEFKLTEEGLTVGIFDFRETPR